MPDTPIIPFIEGDGIGSDITPAMIQVVDSAVEKSYEGNRKIEWMEIFAGEKANEVYNENIWLPDETLDYISEYLVAIKGPLTTPIGGGFRSINVALRQKLDLYVCLRPVRWYSNVPSPVKQPEKIDMVIKGDLKLRFEYSDDMVNLFKKEKKLAKEELHLWLNYWRDVLLTKIGADELVIHNSRLDSFKFLSNQMTADSIFLVIKKLLDTLNLLDKNINPNLAIEQFVISLPEIASEAS